MMKSPKVSIIIPTYNRSALLREAVASVRAQTFTDWELLIVDDGSKDDTAEVGPALAAGDTRIRYLRQTNQGVAMARNAGVEAAHGEFIAFLDDDDQWLPEKLSRQTAFMESHPEVGLSYTRYLFVGGTSGQVQVYPEDVHTTLESLISGACYIPTLTVMVRRDALSAVGGFVTKYQPCEDYHLWYRIVQRFAFAGLPEPLAVWTHRQEGYDHLTKDGILNNLMDIQILRDLRLDGLFRRYRPLRRQRIARMHYDAGRRCWDVPQYWRAAGQFALAIWHDPFVRIRMKEPEERGVRLLVQVVKAYAAVPWCLIKGALHAGR